jgi:hypothetical protein
MSGGEQQCFIGMALMVAALAAGWALLGLDPASGNLCRQSNTRDLGSLVVTEQFARPFCL